MNSYIYIYIYIYISHSCKAIDTELEVLFCFDVLAYHLDMHFSYVFLH